MRSIAIFLVAFISVHLVASSAWAQGFPPGSYQQSCGQVHWSGSTLVAECQRADGRNHGTGLADAARCRGDIANIDGELRCVAGGPPAGQGYGAPSGPGYPPAYPGYGSPQPGSDEHRLHCEELWHREHELRERLEANPWDPDRDRLQYRLHEIHEERERWGCEH